MPHFYDDDPTLDQTPEGVELRLRRLERMASRVETALFTDDGKNRLEEIIDYVKGARLINGIVKWCAGIAMPVIAAIAYLKGSGK